MAGVKLDEYRTMYDVEDTLWWYRGMEAITRAVLEKYYPRGGSLRILDAGCGTGAVIHYLQDYGQPTGVDLVHYALHLARQRGQERLACASVTELPFGTAGFDLVTSIDVLTMLDKGLDETALREFNRVLVPGGRLVLRLAAYDKLRGAHDREWRVQHRYTASEVRTRLKQNGFQVELTSYANMWLFAPAALKRWAERFFPSQQKSDLSLKAGALNGVLAAILGSESRWVVGPGLPIGLSLVAVGRKPPPGRLL